MTLTLKDLISQNKFDDCRSEPAKMRLCADDMEKSFYGRYGDDRPLFDVMETFSDKNNVEVIAINTWICTDAEVGLEILRMQEKPVALIWKPGRKSDLQISYLSKDAFDAVRSAWEASKTPQEIDASFVTEATLGMPISPSGSAMYDVGDLDNGQPCLSIEGIHEWVESEGGLDKITSIPSLEHSSNVLLETIQNYENMLLELRKKASDTTTPLNVVYYIEASETKLHELKNLNQQFQNRISKLS